VSNLRLLLSATLYATMLAALPVLAAGPAAAQAGGEAAAQDDDWVSYRDAYRQMIRFDKYGKPKHLIQQHYQVAPKDKSMSMDGVRLTLAGPSTRLNMALDGVGRATFPLLKSAYDDNARLVLNRKAGSYTMQPRISIVPRADGVYEAADLQAACEQALNYLRYIGRASMQDRKCIGVRFSYAQGTAESLVRFRSADQVQKEIAMVEGSAFPDDAAPLLRAATYRFSEWPEKGQVVTQSAPVAIAPVFD
jgi:hypothetical protein